MSGVGLGEAGRDPAAVAERCAEIVLDHVATATRRPGASEEVEALVSATAGVSALTRFANRAVHQHVTEEHVEVTLTIAVGGRVAQAATTRTEPVALASLVERARAAVDLVPPDPDHPGMAPPATLLPVEHHDPATAAAGPERRVALVAAFLDGVGGLDAAGFCSTDAAVTVLATTAGAAVRGATSRAQLDAIARAGSAGGHPADGYAQATSVSIGDLDAPAVGARAATKARAARDPVALAPGDYEVVLEPKAVAEALLFPAYLGFNGKAHAEGTSFVRLGDQQWDESIDIADDATDPRALGLAFDAEGTPKRRVELVRAGRSVGLVHDRRSARRAGVEPTGHSVGSASFGAFPSDLFLASGSLGVDELVAGVGRGLLVTDLWYNRIVDPRTQVVTGLTRNGLYLVEDGEVVAPVANLRFTQSIVGAFGPGRVRSLGDDAQLVPNEGGVFHVPSVHLASWTFTGDARG